MTPGIQLAGPGAHGQAVERRKSHRAFGAAPIGERAHGGAAAEVRDNHAAGSNLRSLFQDSRLAMYS